MSKRYAIGEVSILCNIPIKTLRYYDEIELLQPKYRNTESNYRYYSKEQLTTLLIIRRLRAQGFCLKDIKDLISDTELSNLEEKMEQRCAEITAEINLLQVKKDACESRLSRVCRGMDIVDRYHCSSSQLEIKIEEIPRGRMIYSREIMKQYRNADVSLQRWTDIYEQCTALGIHMKSPIIVTFHNNALDQFLMKDCDVEFGVLVGEEVQLPAEVTNVREWGDMEAATAYHVGKYSEIMQSHVALIQWIHQNGYEIAGAVSEEFIISPLDINDENDHVTKIIMPIERIKSRK